jgi:hypothetical protein
MDRARVKIMSALPCRMTIAILLESCTDIWMTG